MSDAPKPTKKKKKASVAGAAGKTRPPGAPKAAARSVSSRDERARRRADREPKNELPWFLWVVAAVMGAGIVAMVAFGRGEPRTEAATAFFGKKSRNSE